MKDEKKVDIEIKGEVKTDINVKQEEITIPKQQSGGNAPSGFGAIKRPTQRNGGMDNLTNKMPQLHSSLPMDENSASGSSGGNSGSRNNRTTAAQGRQTNRTNQRQTTKSRIGRNRKKDVDRKANRNMAPNENPLLNQNKMRNKFNNKGNKENNDLKTNPSANVLNGKNGFFKNAFKRRSSIGVGTASKTKKPALENVAFRKKTPVSLVQMFKALPLKTKLIIAGVGSAFFVLVIVVVMVVAASTSSSDGNRQLKYNYIQGDYTEEELCQYLERNKYINTKEQEECEKTPAYQFFTNFKTLVNEYELKYYRYRFNVNIELLYETMANHFSDDEMYKMVKKSEIKNLIDAMLEEIEESCVEKKYDKKKKECKETKWTYYLYEFSLNKYISYLRYGKTSMHPNYGNDPMNKSKNGKSVVRVCGTGLNVDYVFGYGLVNTSSSPLEEFSDCKGNPVVPEDYERLSPTYTSLEEISARKGVYIFGGVPKFIHDTKHNKEQVSELPPAVNGNV